MTAERPLRVATFYESRLGRNDGPPLYWTHAMRSLGFEVEHLSSANSPDAFGKFDVYIWIDWGEDGLAEILPFNPISMEKYSPSIYVTSDTHLGYKYRRDKAKEFTNVFCNQIRAVEEFGKDGVAATFLPHAVEPQAYPDKPVAIKKYDIGFVGFVTFQKRVDMLDELFKSFPNFWYGQRLFEEAAEIYRKSRIVFNTAADDDINMRVFEVLATGSFLLTEWVPTLGELFEDGVHLVTYKTMDEAIEKAKYYLEHEEEREKIAKAGHDLVLKSHTYQNRVLEAFEKIGLLKEVDGGRDTGEAVGGRS